MNKHKFSCRSCKALLTNGASNMCTATCKPGSISELVIGYRDILDIDTCPDWCPALRFIPEGEHSDKDD